MRAGKVSRAAGRKNVNLAADLLVSRALSYWTTTRKFEMTRARSRLMGNVTVSGAKTAGAG